MPVQTIGKLCILLGAVLLLTGVALVYFKNASFLNWLGKLPGDIRVEGENSAFYFPWVTCLVISGVLTLLNLLWRFLSK